MIGVICFGLIGCGVCFAVWNGTLDAVSRAMLEIPGECVDSLIRMVGAVCFFSGIAKIVERSGGIRLFSGLLRRPLGVLIPQSRIRCDIRESVTLNFAANFFGLGNAATPAGVRAGTALGERGMNRSLARFLILNTCSVQLFPTAVCALRAAHGSENVTAILPAVWCVQSVTCILGIVLTGILFRGEE